MERREEVEEEDERMIVVDQNGEDPSNAVDPFGPEMVATVTEEMVATVTEPALSLMASSLDRVLADSSNILSAPPDVNNILWQTLNKDPPQISPAPSSMMSLYSPVSEQERNKLATSLIINCIQRQTALWDSTDKSFGDFKLCSILWKNIASVCGFDVKKLRLKWATLKKTYKKEYVKSTTTGVTSKSPNFAAMSFLEEQIKRELKRENEEKGLAMMQLHAAQRRNGGDGFDVVVDDEDEDDENSDCLIVGNDCLSESTARSSGISSTPVFSSVAAPSRLSTKPPKISHLNSTPTSRSLSNARRHSAETELVKSDGTRPSPDVVYLVEREEPQETDKKQYTVVVGQPVIKFTPKRTVGNEKLDEFNNQPVKQQRSPTVNKQCAKKSISRGSLMLFSGQNGEVTPREPQPSNANVGSHRKPEVKLECRTPSLTVENAMPWKIENPRTVVTNKSEPDDDDEIQIIKEVTRNVKTTSSPKPIQPTPPKKPRLDTDPSPTQVPTKKQIDKDREQSANEHFLLGLLYDVESLNKKQFRSLRKHSTALVSLILDRR